MRFILPHAPDAHATSFNHPKTSASVTIALPCTAEEKALIEQVLGIEMVPAPERPKPKDGDQ